MAFPPDQIGLVLRHRSLDMTAYYAKVDVALLNQAAQSVPVAVDVGALQVSPEELQAALLLFYSLLDEQQRRLYAGLESMRLGHGGDTLLADFLALDAHRVARGRQQLLDQDVAPPGRTRRVGGGRIAAEKNARPSLGHPPRRNGLRVS